MTDGGGEQAVVRHARTPCLRGNCSAAAGTGCTRYSITAASAGRKRPAAKDQQTDRFVRRDAMRHRWVQMLAVSILLAVVPGLVLAQSEAARWRVDTAIYYISNGWFPEALEHLQQAARSAPDDAEAYFLMGMLFDVLGEPERALAAYRRAMELAPDAAPYAVLMGDIYWSAGMLDEAQRAYEQALSEFPEAGTAHYGLARVLAAKQSDGVIDTLRAAVQHAPDLIDARLLLGRLLRLNGELEEALEHLLHANRL